MDTFESKAFEGAKEQSSIKLSTFSTATAKLTPPEQPPVLVSEVEDYHRVVFHARWIIRTASTPGLPGRFEDSPEFRSYRMKVRDIVNGQGPRRS